MQEGAENEVLALFERMKRAAESPDGSSLRSLQFQVLKIHSRILLPNTKARNMLAL